MSTTRSRSGGRRPSRGAASTRAASRARQRARRRLLIWGGVVGVSVVVVLAVISLGGGGGGGSSSGPRFDVGQPASGSAPPIRLPMVGGGTWDLGADGKDETVLLYFQEGVGCQPCWEQITDIEADFDPFRQLGIDELVTITVDPLDLLAQKIGDEGIASVALSDADLSLGPSYNANQYGMMGTSTYGHTFVVVGPDGRIRWRADYGGSPDYTMFVPVEALLDDMRAGLGAQPSAS